MSVVKNKKREQLPRDIDALIALLEDRDELLVKRDERIAALEHTLAVYARMLFSSSSEKRRLTGIAAGHPHQLALFMADLVADAERIAEATGVTGHVEVEPPPPARRTGKNSRRAKSFPDHLQVVETLFELSEDKLVCACGGELHLIGFEETRELERIEVTIVHRKKRAKYACRCCEEGVVTAAAPGRVIDKGRLGPGFLAHVIAERFQFHMPYHRLEKKYAGEGLTLSRSVLKRSVARCAELLEPLYLELGKEVIAEPVIFTDDTTVTLARLAEREGSRTARIWVYLDKLGRHFYDFTDSRSRAGPERILKDFSGFMHADALGNYDIFYQSGLVTEVACWAHARRKFKDAMASDPKLAEEALELIGELYQVEKAARSQGLDAEGLRALRQQHSVPVLERIHAWLGVTEALVLPKSPMAKAVRYALNQWDALKVYTTDGRLEIDNNAAERALRPIAVGRKNWLFFQSQGGGKTAAIMMSLIQTAAAAGVNVKLYLRDVLQRIATESDVKKLLPHGWKQHFESDVEGRRNEIIELLVKSRG
jgi:transposase